MLDGEEEVVSKVHHIAWFRRDAPDFHSGGVPVFGEYARQRLGAAVWAWSSHPEGYRGGVAEVNAAEQLSAWLHESGALAGAKAVIVDGFWGRGLPAAPPYDVYSVAHGTWRGFAADSAADPPFVAHAARLGEIQAAEYARRKVVAVSEKTRIELREHYGVEAVAVIPNAVDTDEFRPRPREKTPRTRPLVLYPSEGVRKGGDVVAALRGLLPDVEFRQLGGETGSEAARMAQGDVFLSASRAEGNSYAALQAMACGLPMVVSPAGLFAYPKAVRLDLYGWGLIVPDGADAPAAKWADAVAEALQQRDLMGPEARRWSVERNNLDQWEAAWRDLIGLPRS